ncbi:MAG: HU family DNA-binding protein [Clostridiales bacterium]|nr:HU family DNA-binding protein [Clostridiales bacterium]
MNKTELCARLALETGQTKKEAEETVNKLLLIITDALAEGERVQLVGFGSFEVKQRAARVGRDMKTGEPIQVPPTKAVQFKPSRNLKDLVK